MAHLSLLQRKQIEAGIARGKSNAQIALEAGVHRATIGREIKRNALSRELYEAQEAHEMAQTTQRMAVSLRNFEGLGAYACSFREKKKESRSVKADFFQLDFYHRSATLQFSFWSFAVNSVRNRYTDYERIDEGYSFSIKHPSLFGGVYECLFASAFLNDSSLKFLSTGSSLLANSFSSSDSSAETENTACNNSTLQVYLPDTIDLQLKLNDSEAFHPFFDETKVVPVTTNCPRSETKHSQSGISSIQVGTSCKFYVKDDTFSCKTIFSSESFSNFPSSF